MQANDISDVIIHKDGTYTYKDGKSTTICWASASCHTVDQKSCRILKGPGAAYEDDKMSVLCLSKVQKTAVQKELATHYTLIQKGLKEEQRKNEKAIFSSTLMTRVTDLNKPDSNQVVGFLDCADPQLQSKLGEIMKSCDRLIQLKSDSGREENLRKDSVK